MKMSNLSKGVFLRSMSDGSLSYRSSFTFRGKHISLGSYDTEEAAHSAYLEALSLTRSAPFLTLLDYENKKRVLPFSKWVIILNFRDNGLYLKSPIYLKKKYFNYYLSPSFVLKFDADDLFYFAEKQISRRGGHFFVADFGMQVNLLSRYGIRNFAVPGKDYVFLNGDDTDFRYENIEIINRYYGVRKERLFPSPIFVSKINVNGSIIIGRYSSENEAAVAYNKAADLLSSAGVTKRYERNFLADLSSEDYLELYETVPLRKDFRKLISSLKDSKGNPQAPC